LRRIIQDETDIGLYVGSAAGASTQQMGEEKELVLFFLDIRDFTPFVETHLAFDVIHIIRKLFAVLQDIIEGNGGKIIETAGDGLYAAFGYNADKGKSGLSAVQSAFSIIDSLESLNETYFQPHFDFNLAVGIGIHVVKVINGSVRIGSDDHMVVIGFPVNVAARLQNATKELNNNLLVSKEVYELLSNTSIASTPSSVFVKGISEPLTVYPLGKPYH
jgi:adenylate cyclase